MILRRKQEVLSRRSQRENTRKSLYTDYQEPHDHLIEIAVELIEVEKSVMITMI